MRRRLETGPTLGTWLILILILAWVILGLMVIGDMDDRCMHSYMNMYSILIYIAYGYIPACTSTYLLCVSKYQVCHFLKRKDKLKSSYNPCNHSTWKEKSLVPQSSGMHQ